METPMTDAGRQDSGIRTPDQRLRVFVSSTLQELAPERASAREAIEQLRMAPVMFESGARPHPAQAVYRAYLQQSDIFVGIYWQRYGWVGPDMTISGLEDELRLAGDMPRLLYFKVPAPDMDAGLAGILEKVEAEGSSAYRTFAGAEELRALVLTDLATMLAERFGGGGRDGRDGPRLLAPSPVTGLVGRDDDIDEVVRLLSAQDRRLVVLTGAGGIGKTRLALAVMERTKARWRDGAAFVDLSSVTDSRLVPDAIAAALGLVVQGRERPLDALGRRLAGRNMLIVVDNFEHVLEGSPMLADLLQRAPELHLLVTSRVVLRVRGEQEWVVAPLRCPAAGAAPAELAEAPAVRLLVERVRDVQPRFELTGENAEAVAELCRRLEGLPLALELAAAWMRLLTPDQMLARLYERLDRPGALADLPGRQQTLTDTIEWSYNLLPAPARQLLARLSVFAAPFTTGAAEAVCGQDGADAVAGLSTLLDHSMVSPADRPDGKRAFRLLEPIRRFAAARLENADETLSRLERYLLDVLKTAGATHGSQNRDLRRLDSEQPNLQVVLGWLARKGGPSVPLLQAIGEVWVWLLVRGHLRRTSELWQQIESLPEQGLRTGRDRLALSFLTAAMLVNDGGFADAVSLVDEMLPDARQLEKPSRIGTILMQRGIARPYKAHSPARADFEEALAVVRDAGDPLALGYVLAHYGSFLCLDGDAGRARALHEEMLQIARSLGDQNLRAEAHYDLAIDALSAGDVASAPPHLVTAVRYYQSLDHLDGLTRCLGALSALALAREHPHLAARLIGTTAAARDRTELTPWPAVSEAERRTNERARALLPRSEFAAQVASGRGQTIEDALTQALQTLAGEAPAATFTQTPVD
jgi:predicted ATPase